MKYYNLYEITEEEAKLSPMAVYTDDNEKLYTLNCGDMISTLAADGKTILKNTEIEGVVEAESDEDAAEKLNVHLLLQD